MNFCVSILNGRWKKICNIFGIMLFFKKGKNITEMQIKICAVYGEVAVTD